MCFSYLFTYPSKAFRQYSRSWILITIWTKENTYLKYNAITLKSAIYFLVWARQAVSKLFFIFIVLVSLLLYYWLPLSLHSEVFYADLLERFSSVSYLYSRVLNIRFRPRLSLLAFLERKKSSLSIFMIFITGKRFIKIICQYLEQNLNRHYGFS